MISTSMSSDTVAMPRVTYSLRSSTTATVATRGRELLDVFAEEGVDAAFVYTFARYDLPHRDAPHTDLDLASAGVVRVLDGRGGSRSPRYADMPWEPKAAFDTLANWNAR